MAKQWQFQKGNEGRPKGTKNKRTQQWEALAESITGRQAEYFNDYLEELWESSDPKIKNQAAELFLKTLEYFKPKQQRTEVQQDDEMIIRIVHE